MIEGKGGIYAKVIADSTANSVRLTTLELKYPRFIHAEFMTHRMFSRNASSSRAIPVERVLGQVENDPAMPIHWGKNQPGMQAREELAPARQAMCKSAWLSAGDEATAWADSIRTDGGHKQIVNRLTEPFQFIKVVVTATEWDNFFALRLHEDAQPEIYELARVMRKSLDASTPMQLGPCEYHLPYVDSHEEFCTFGHHHQDEVLDYREHEAVKASVARCARVSYNNHDGTTCDVASDIKLYDRLLESQHMSPFEHVAQPMDMSVLLSGELDLGDGVTHFDQYGSFWSGNFKSWIQHRQVV